MLRDDLRLSYYPEYSNNIPRILQEYSEKIPSTFWEHFKNVSRTTYQNLFSRLGTTFGGGDGSTTFTLPNYQGLFMRGMGSQTINGTTYTGVSVNNAQQDSIQNHQHGPQNGSYLGTQTSASNSGGYLSSAGLQRPNQYNFDNTGTIAVSGRVNSDETRVVNVGIYYYIKT